MDDQRKQKLFQHGTVQMFSKVLIHEENVLLMIMLFIQASGKQAMAHKKVMTSSQTDGNCSIVHPVQHTYIWVLVTIAKFVILLCRAYPINDR